MSGYRLPTHSVSTNRRCPLTGSGETGPLEIQETFRRPDKVFVKEIRAKQRRREDEINKYCRHLMIRNHTTVEHVGTTHLLRQDDVDLVDLHCVETGFELRQILRLHALLHP